MLALLAPLLCTLLPIAVMVVGGYLATHAARPEVQARKARELGERIALSRVPSASESRRVSAAHDRALTAAAIGELAGARTRASERVAAGLPPYAPREWSADAQLDRLAALSLGELAAAGAYADCPNPPVKVYAL